MLLTALAARQWDGAPLSPPKSSFLCQAIDSASMSPQCELVIFLPRLQFPYRIPSEDVFLKMVSATFSDLFNSKRLLPLPHSIHHCPLAPPSVCFSFYSAPPESSHPHPPCSSIGCCLFKLRHNIPRLFMEANFSTQIPFFGSPCSHPASLSSSSQSSSSSSWAP